MQPTPSAEIAKSRLHWILAIDRSTLNEGRLTYYTGRNAIVFDQPITVLSDEVLDIEYDTDGNWHVCIHKEYP